MDYRVIVPTYPLSAFIKCFWTLEGNGEDKGIVSHRLFADALPTLVFHYRNHFTRSGPDPVTYPSGILHGQTSEITDMQVRGAFGIFGVYCYPSSIRKLFHFPARLIADNYLELNDFLGAEGEALQDRVFGCHSNAERVKVVSEFLLKRIAEAAYEDTVLDACISHVLSTHGEDPVRKMASLSGKSVRQIERKFSGAVGLAPKTFSRIVRFQHAIALYERKKVSHLTTLSYRAGYYDQSHFIREFRTFSGFSPRHYFKGLSETAEGFARLQSSVQA